MKSSPLNGVAPRERRGEGLKPLTTPTESVIAAASGDLRAWLILAAYQGALHRDRTGYGEHVRGDLLEVLGKGDVGASMPTRPLHRRTGRVLTEDGATGSDDQRALPASPVGRHRRRDPRTHFRAQGIEHGSIHRLRHWCVTPRHGGNLRIAQEYARHSSPATTAITRRSTATSSGPPGFAAPACVDSGGLHVEAHHHSGRARGGRQPRRPCVG